MEITLGSKMSPLIFKFSMFHFIDDFFDVAKTKIYSFSKNSYRSTAY
jgi:hypothetical protein